MRIESAVMTLPVVCVFELLVCCATTIVETVITTITLMPTTTANLIFNQVIIFMVPFTRVKVDAAAIDPFATATAVTDFASATGVA